jgi:proline iminopeptidase
MQYYSNKLIGLIAEDFEVMGKYFGIGQWLVLGGSYGLTIGLNYATMFPESCIAFILQASIWTQTPK